MAFMTSYAAAAAQLDAVTALVGNAGLARFYSGTAPANCEAAATGTMLLEITLGSPPWAASADQNPGALAAVTGTPSNTAAAGGAEPGTAVGYVRVYEATGTTCVFQDDDITASGGGGRVQLTDTTIATGQNCTITSWNLTQAES